MACELFGGISKTFHANRNRPVQQQSIIPKMQAQEVNDSDKHKLNISCDQHQIIANGQYVLFGKNGKEGLEGPCRLVDREGNVVQGIFTNGFCSRAHVFYVYANFAVGEWRNGGLNGIATVYDSSGLKIYEGQMKNSKRDGEGVEYNYLTKCVLSGPWVNDKKHGWIEQRLMDTTIDELFEGNYEEGLRHGPFTLHANCKEQVRTFHRGRRIEQESESVEIETEIKQNHSQANTMDQSLTVANISIPNECMTDLAGRKMLDTAVLTAFARKLFLYLENRNWTTTTATNRTYLFGTDLLQNYSGFSLHHRNYRGVKHLTRHLQGNFSLVSGFWSTIMFPLTNGPHFTLAVVRIHHQNNHSDFKMEYYDSLNGTYLMNTVKHAIQNFLKDQYYHHYRQQKQSVLNGLNSMYQHSNLAPRQYDGVSCGVFVCKYMYQLVMKHSIEAVHHNQGVYIEGFRDIIKAILHARVEEIDKVCQLEAAIYKWVKNDYQRFHKGRMQMPQDLSSRLLGFMRAAQQPSGLNDQPKHTLKPPAMRVGKPLTAQTDTPKNEVQGIRILSMNKRSSSNSNIGNSATTDYFPVGKKKG